jgi:heat shock protein HtpX
VLFVLTNLPVMVVLSIMLKVFGIDRAMALEGFNLGPAAPVLSRLRLRRRDHFASDIEAGGEVVHRRAAHRRRRGFDASACRMLRSTKARRTHSQPAYSRNSALVAVSTGLLQSMSQEEVEAVLGHEVAHVANGDMVTLTLIQGVLRTFVVFLARIVGTMSTVRCSAGSRGGSGQLHHGLRV